MTQNSEMADIRKNFYEIYNKKLQGILSDFEKKRKAWILNCILIGIAGILIMVFCIKIAPFISVAIPFLYCLICKINTFSIHYEILSRPIAF